MKHAKPQTRKNKKRENCKERKVSKRLKNKNKEKFEEINL